jgi:hypothetical protein
MSVVFNVSGACAGLLLAWITCCAGEGAITLAGWFRLTVRYTTTPPTAAPERAATPASITTKTIYTIRFLIMANSLFLEIIEYFLCYVCILGLQDELIMNLRGQYHAMLDFILEFLIDN